MSLWRTLAGALGLAGESGDGELTDLAALLAAEVRLYQERELASSTASGRLSTELIDEIGSAYWKYVERAGVSSETRAIFCRVFSRVLAAGDQASIEAAVESAEASGPPALGPSW
jgi:hypothetical protein